MNFEEKVCVFPDDGGACETHGTVLCYLAPITSSGVEEIDDRQCR